MRRSRLDRPNDHVPDGAVASARSTHDADHQQLAAAGVIGDLQARFLLDHPCASSAGMSTCTAAPLPPAPRSPGGRCVPPPSALRFDTGRLSTMITSSPAGSRTHRAPGTACWCARPCRTAGGDSCGRRAPSRLDRLGLGYVARHPAAIVAHALLPSASPVSWRSRATVANRAISRRACFSRV